MKPLSLILIITGTIIAAAGIAFCITKIIMGKKRKKANNTGGEENEPLHPMYEYATVKKSDISDEDEDVCECFYDMNDIKEKESN